MFEAKEDVLNGLWDGPCNSEDPPTWDDDEGPYTEYTPPTPADYPGCGCDCADLLRRDLATCTENSCTNIAQQYALPGSKCEGSDVTWDLSASSDNCADNLYGDGSFDSTWGDACLDDDGNVQAASETCYQTLASNDEAALTDKKSNIAQCERGASNEDNCCELNVGAVVGTAIALLVVLVGSILACCKFCPGCPMNNAGGKPAKRSPAPPVHEPTALAPIKAETHEMMEAPPPLAPIPKEPEVPYGYEGAGAFAAEEGEVAPAEAVLAAELPPPAQSWAPELEQELEPEC